jgi:hypothetical protein
MDDEVKKMLQKANAALATLDSRAPQDGEPDPSPEEWWASVLEEAEYVHGRTS